MGKRSEKLDTALQTAQIVVAMASQTEMGRRVLSEFQKQAKAETGKDASVQDIVQAVSHLAEAVDDVLEQLEGVKGEATADAALLRVFALSVANVLRGQDKPGNDNNDDNTPPPANDTGDVAVADDGDVAVDDTPPAGDAPAPGGPV